ncbi:uncharacterized protein EV422DRAFT_516753 [Fimicolochytrium jonesii]|uniref:uncharacterized protein n=1 Tax=Fimicolochytrium jonesii TaxID=1396493 RepID=UPI0022FE0579|nr:uncharacterized protein EV422DRAFT_516753 [Fimicolochytrium jonesii]KAI8824910.1 hypothetical protein EV422DRAFT_516753 [Fimicolochytrium jonesii]
MATSTVLISLFGHRNATGVFSIDPHTTSGTTLRRLIVSRFFPGLEGHVENTIALWDVSGEDVAWDDLRLTFSTRNEHVERVFPSARRIRRADVYQPTGEDRSVGVLAVVPDSVFEMMANGPLAAQEVGGSSNGPDSQHDMGAVEGMGAGSAVAVGAAAVAATSPHHSGEDSLVYAERSDASPRPMAPEAAYQQQNQLRSPPSTWLEATPVHSDHDYELSNLSPAATSDNPFVDHPSSSPSAWKHNVSNSAYASEATSVTVHREGPLNTYKPTPLPPAFVEHKRGMSGKKKIIVIAAGLILLLIAGGVTAFFLLKAKNTTDAGRASGVGPADTTVIQKYTSPTGEMYWELGGSSQFEDKYLMLGLRNGGDYDQFDYTTGAFIRRFSGLVRGLMHPNGRLFIGHNNVTVTAWSLDDGSIVKSLPMPANASSWPFRFIVGSDPNPTTHSLLTGTLNAAGTLLDGLAVWDFFGSGQVTSTLSMARPQDQLEMFTYGDTVGADIVVTYESGIVVRFSGPPFANAATPGTIIPLPAQVPKPQDWEVWTTTPARTSLFIIKDDKAVLKWNIKDNNAMMVIPSLGDGAFYTSNDITLSKDESTFYIADGSPGGSIRVYSAATQKFVKTIDPGCRAVMTMMRADQKSLLVQCYIKPEVRLIAL